MSPPLRFPLPPTTGLPEPQSLAQLRAMLSPPGGVPFRSAPGANSASAVGNLFPGTARSVPFQSVGPANTAAGLGNLYSQPGYGSLPYASPSPPMNSAASVGNLYQSGPMGELPRGGSTGIYNNRFLSAQEGLLNQAGGSGGAARAAGGAGRGALGRGAAQAMEAEAATAAASAGRFLAPGRAMTLPGVLGGRALPGALGRGGMAAGLARGLGYSVAGGIGADLLDQANIGGEGSFADQALPGAARGAGYGAAFGPWGAAIGAGLGGIATGLDIPILNQVFGGGEDAPEQAPIAQQYASAAQNINNAFATAGVPQERMGQFWSTIQANLDLVGPEGQEQALAALLTPGEDGSLPPILANAQSFIQSAQQQTQQMTPTDIANIQGQVGRFLQPYQQQITQTGDLAAAALTNPANMAGLSPQYQAALGAQAATQRANAARMSAAIGAQGQVLPAITAHQQAIAQSFQQPQGGGSGTDLEAILASLNG